jgi:1-aminocyclopropane-1-carboxylate deaminase/D-cysteine desulfhydrase-like pyridoxal-dependent ACC family enzyme
MAAQIARGRAREHRGMDAIAAALDGNPRLSLATLPTPLERGPELPGGARLWCKRDDLTGLGAGGNKARKLEFLCAEALAAGARSLVTVGAAQSNHCRMTAAAGARLGLDVHLVLAGDRPDRLEGNVALASLFGAHLHFAGCADHHWGELEIAGEQLTAELAADGLAPHAIPIGGSTPTGALGYVAAYGELLDQLDAAGIEPRGVVFTSSSGGTHAGLVAGRALARAGGRPGAPPVLAIGVAKGVAAGHPDIAELAAEALAAIDTHAEIVAADVELDGRWVGDDYAVPSAAGDEAIVWAARRSSWVLDRTYTGKGFAGLLGNAAEGRWGAGDDVVFLHTGGLPAVCTTSGLP